MNNDNISLVLDELENARQKHPLFVHQFQRTDSFADMDQQLRRMRELLAIAVLKEVSDFEDVLICELYEAKSAYAHGDLAHARQELAQCAAVCIRGMEYIEAEIAEQHTTKENNTNG